MYSWSQDYSGQWKGRQGPAPKHRGQGSGLRPVPPPFPVRSVLEYLRLPVEPRLAYAIVLMPSLSMAARSFRYWKYGEHSTWFTAMGIRAAEFSLSIWAVAAPRKFPD